MFYQHQDFTEISRTQCGYGIVSEVNKVVFNFLHFVFVNVHIDGLNKYRSIEEANKFLPLNCNIFAFFKRCFWVRFLDKIRFYK